MTKPANFPERVRQRRLGALARLRDKSGEEATILRARTSSIATGVKTKKDHSHLAKLRRG